MKGSFVRRCDLAPSDGGCATFVFEMKLIWGKITVIRSDTKNEVAN
jgi:hypothetical protein